MKETLGIDCHRMRHTNLCVLTRLPVWICNSLVTGSDPAATGTCCMEIKVSVYYFTFKKNDHTNFGFNVFSEIFFSIQFSFSSDKLFSNTLFSRHLLKDWILQWALPVLQCLTFLWSPSLFKLLHLDTQQFGALKVLGVCFVWLLSGNKGL